MSTASPATTLHFLTLLAVAAVAAGEDGLTHLHLYIHATIPWFTGANTNASTASLSMGSQQPPWGNPWFGSMGAIDDELRDGPDPASPYLGRAQGMLVQADLGSPAAWCTTVVLAFTEGDYAGSTLVVDGRVDLAADVVERGVVGGTGRFRRARGYSLTTRFGDNPTTPSGNTTVVVFEMDPFVKIIGG
ncbi:hypothetical protein HU200_034955 [Digitaria exilis]|uniref:Dirigent protein n=1 Tax=Digitaria exilis TaxID=1010633 RepID=A0A835BIX9_9POAL|nr:hypothetical protein HU200_034955 [Digitaria exilis]CAB3495675.1 unnamed protein product [Digitaria exilis]